MKRLYLPRRAALRLTAAAVCLVLFLTLLCLRTMLVYSLDAQSAAERWSVGDVRFAQVTALLAEGAGPDYYGVQALGSKIDAALAGESLTAGDNTRLWISAYSAQDTLTAVSDRATSQVRAIATGGDFFQFHPLDMISGWYYDQDDLMQDQVVLDQSLAWALFGGYDLTGMTLTIGGIPCRVVGVAQTPSGLEGKAYGTDQPTLWLSWSLYEKLNENAVISCYEAVLPDPVDGWAKDTLTTALGLTQASCEVVENSQRFDYLPALKTLFNLGARTQRTTALQYPYWENAARLADVRCALLTGGMALCLLWPVVWVIFLAVKYTRRLLRLARNAINRRKL